MPLPAVLPPLPPMPRPTRRLAFVEPGAGFRSWILMVTGNLSELYDFDEMRHSCDHPADLGAVGQRVGAADLAEAERAQRAAVLGFDADLRLAQRHLQLGRCAGHHATSSFVLYLPRPRSRYAASMARGATS